MHCDNQVVISKVSSKNFNEKGRHLRASYTYIRNLITHGIIFIDFVKLERNIVDHLPKGLTRE